MNRANGINQRPPSGFKEPLKASSLTTEEQEWLDSKEAAIYLRLSTKVLLNLTSDGKIRHFKLGRRNRYRKSDLRELLLSEPRGEQDGN